jgi:hypothetical protein
MRKATTMPETLPGRLSFVGQELYGRDYHGSLADGLGVHRATLWRWLSGKRPQHDVDGDILELLDREHAQSYERAGDIAALKKALMIRIKGALK